MGGGWRRLIGGRVVGGACSGGREQRYPRTQKNRKGIKRSRGTKYHESRGDRTSTYYTPGCLSRNDRDHPSSDVLIPCYPGRRQPMGTARAVTGVTPFGRWCESAA